MQNYNMLLIILTIIAASFAGMAVLIPYLIKKGINISGLLSGTSNALDTAEVVMDGLAEYFPENKTFTTIDRIIDYAQKATQAAEQLYITSQIEAGERKRAATELVYEFLNAAEIEISEEIKIIVDGCIEAAVFVLPNA